MRCDAFPKRRAKSFVHRAFSFLGTLPKASNGEPLQITEEIWIDRWKERAKRQITEDRLGYHSDESRCNKETRSLYGTKRKDKERKRKEGRPRIYRKFERARNSSIDLEPSWDYTNHNHDTSWKRTNYTLHQTGNVLRFFYDISTVLPIADLKSEYRYLLRSRVFPHYLPFSVTLRNIEFPIYVLSGRRRD